MRHYLSFITAYFNNQEDFAKEYYLKNKEDIDHSIKAIIKKHPLDNKDFFKGYVLSQDEGILEEVYLDEKEIISFTDSLEVAKEYADLENDLSKYLKDIITNARGYIAKHYELEGNQLIFHHSWTSVLGLDIILPHDTVKQIYKDQEVLLFYHQKASIKIQST